MCYLKKSDYRIVSWEINSEAGYNIAGLPSSQVPSILPVKSSKKVLQRVGTREGTTDCNRKQTKTTLPKKSIAKESNSKTLIGVPGLPSVSATHVDGKMMIIDEHQMSWVL